MSTEIALDEAHEPVLQLFRTQLERLHLADSYLFLGPSRSRLRLLARTCAGWLLQVRGALEDHPDFLVFDPDELGVKGLKVEHVAERDGAGNSVEGALRYKALRGGYRAVLMFEIDCMTLDAQAALLKTAEEPPKGTIFMLTAADPSPILPALLSRCRVHRVGPPSADEINRRAALAGLSDAEMRILGHALGRQESVFDLSLHQRQGFLALHAEFQNWLIEPLSAPNWLKLPDGNLAEQRSTASAQLAAILGWAQAAYVQSSAEQGLRLDRLSGLLAEALGDIRSQLTPSLILEHLRIEIARL
jgi:DNA polymerase III delta subunit-like protein